jgi:hypothetical protein
VWCSQRHHPGSRERNRSGIPRRLATEPHSPRPPRRRWRRCLPRHGPLLLSPRHLSCRCSSLLTSTLFQKQKNLTPDDPWFGYCFSDIGFVRLVFIRFGFVALCYGCACLPRVRIAVPLPETREACVFCFFVFLMLDDDGLAMRLCCVAVQKQRENEKGFVMTSYMCLPSNIQPLRAVKEMEEATATT